MDVSVLACDFESLKFQSSTLKFQLCSQHKSTAPTSRSGEK